MKKSILIMAALIAVLLFSCTNETPGSDGPEQPQKVMRTIKFEENTYEVEDGTEWTFPALEKKEDGSSAVFAMDGNGRIYPFEVPVKVTEDLALKAVWSDRTYSIDLDTGYVACTGGTSPVAAIPYMVDGVRPRGIGSKAFKGMTIQDLIIPEWIEGLEYAAFEGVSGLEEIRLPSSITYMEEHVFDEMPGVTIRIDWDDNMDDWSSRWANGFRGKLAFSGKIMEKDGMAFCPVKDDDGSDALSFLKLAIRDGSVAEATIPADVDGIPVISTEKGAFASMAGLKKVTLSKGIRHMGANQFDATRIEEVNLPEGLISIGAYAFDNATTIPVLTIPSTVTAIGDNTFRYLDETQKVIIKSWQNQQKWQWHYIGAEVIHADAIRNEGEPGTFAPWTLDDGTMGLMLAAYDKEAVTAAPEIVIPSECTYTDGTEEKTLPVVWIGSSVFDSTDISSLSVPSSVRGIGNSAFNYCQKLVSVTLNEGLEYIGDACFRSPQWKTLTIPSTVTHMGESVFSYLAKDGVITVKGSEQLKGWNPNWMDGIDGKIVYENIETDENGIKYVHTGTRDGKLAWKAIGAESALSEIKLPSELDGIPVVAIEAYAFMGNDTITDIVLPDTITDIGMRAFYKCTAVENLDLGSGIVYIGNEAFRECSCLKGVTIPKTVEDAGNDIFTLSGIETLTLEEGLEHLPYDGFTRCPNLKSVVIPDSITDIIPGAFSGCTALESVTLGSRTEIIRHSVFSGCTALKSITIPATVKEIHRNSFQDTGIETLTFEVGDNGRASLTYIGGSAFSNTKIKSLTLPEGCRTDVDDQNTYIFSGNKELVSVTLPSDFPVIPKNMFSGCEKLKTVSLPSNLRELKRGAFSNTPALEALTFPPTLTILEEKPFENSGLKHVTFLTREDGSTDMEMFPSEAFMGTGLTSIVFPDSITGFYWDICRNCKELETAVLPKNSENVGASMFEGCVKLKEVTLPEKLEKIYNNAFKGCTDLTEIVIPASVKTIDVNAFDEWTAAQTITCESKAVSDLLKPTLTRHNALVQYIDENGNKVVVRKLVPIAP